MYTDAWQRIFHPQVIVNTLDRYFPEPSAARSRHLKPIEILSRLPTSEFSLRRYKGVIEIDLQMAAVTMTGRR